MTHPDETTQDTEVTAPAAAPATDDSAGDTTGTQFQGAFDPARAEKLVANLRGDIEKSKAKAAEYEAKIAELEAELAARPAGPPGTRPKIGQSGTPTAPAPGSGSSDRPTEPSGVEIANRIRKRSGW